jgi:hypothetical protein
LDENSVGVEEMAEILKHLIELLKLAPRYMAAIALVSGILLYFPDAFLDGLGVLAFKKSHHQWIGITFLVSLVLFVIDRSLRFSEKIRDGNRKAEQITRQVKRLYCLTEEEKQILRFYIGKLTRTNYLKMDDGVVQGLVSCGIIFRVAAIGNMRDGFAYNISDLSWDHLNENPGLLNGETNLYRNDKEENQQRWR